MRFSKLISHHSVLIFGVFDACVAVNMCTNYSIFAFLFVVLLQQNVVI